MKLISCTFDLKAVSGGFKDIDVIQEFVSADANYYDAIEKRRHKNETTRYQYS